MHVFLLLAAKLALCPCRDALMYFSLVFARSARWVKKHCNFRSSFSDPFSISPQRRAKQFGKQPFFTLRRPPFYGSSWRKAYFPTSAAIVVRAAGAEDLRAHPFWMQARLEWQTSSSDTGRSPTLSKPPKLNNSTKATPTLAAAPGLNEAMVLKTAERQKPDKLERKRPTRL